MPGFSIHPDDWIAPGEKLDGILRARLGQEESWKPSTDWYTAGMLMEYINNSSDFWLQIRAIYMNMGSVSITICDKKTGTYRIEFDKANDVPHGICLAARIILKHAITPDTDQQT